MKEFEIDFNSPDVHKGLLEMYIGQLKMMRGHSKDPQFLEDDIEGYQILLECDANTFHQFMNEKNRLRNQVPRRPSNKEIVAKIINTKEREG